MLRSLAPVVRLRGTASVAAVARPQWSLHGSRATAGSRAWRGFADNKTPDKAVLPGSYSQEVSNPPKFPETPTDKPTTDKVAATTITPELAPKLPTDPYRSQTTPPVSMPPTAPAAPRPTTSTPPPPRPKKRRRFRRFLLYTTTLLALTYGGGVYYALVDDDFHDYFTDYVPYGEDAVMYFEERAFKKRFPNGVGTTKLYPQVSGEKKVTISGQSGAAARVAEPMKDTQKSTSPTPKDNLGRTDRAMTETTSSASKESSPKAKQAPASPKAESKPAGEKAADVKGSGPEQTAPAKSTLPQPAAKVAAIDPLKLANASDPAVQKVASMLNDLITVINEDEHASSRYSSTLTKAKDDVQELAKEIAAYRDAQQAAAREQIKQNDQDFDRVAKGMLERAQQAQKEQELQWREEYEKERQRLSENYDNKLQAELNAAQKVADQKLRNELLEQNLKLQDSFAESVRKQVETERGARLSKLTELSTTVSELQKLTSEWNSVVDANLQTQHLVVAVDAVRTALEEADRPTPFLHELAALKESANNNGVINAAIASIRPTAYQKGIPTPAQLIDRFRRVASEVRKASLLPEDAGVASHAASFMLSKVLFKKQGLTAGDDVESILTRTETLLEEGDLDEATRQMNGLTGWARVLSDDWLTDCRRVLEVRQALEVMSTEAKLQSLMVE